MFNDERFIDLKNKLNDSFGSIVEDIVSRYAKEVKEYTKENMKSYVWKLLPAVISEQDLSEFGFKSDEDFYNYINTWKVRNRIRKDFRDELMTDIMIDLKGENMKYKKSIEIISKIIRDNGDYNIRGYRDAVEELRLLDVDIKIKSR